MPRSERADKATLPESHLGAVIRRHRKQRDKTFQEVGRDAGFTSGDYIRLIESDQRCPSLDKVPAIARAVEADPATLCQVWLKTYHPNAADALSTTGFVHQEGSFGKRIKEARRDRGLTLKHVGLSAGYGTGEFINLIEAGQRAPELNRVPDLARALDIDPAHLCAIWIAEYAPTAAQVLFAKRDAE